MSRPKLTMPSSNIKIFAFTIASLFVLNTWMNKDKSLFRLHQRNPSKNPNKIASSSSETEKPTKSTNV